MSEIEKLEEQIAELPNGCVTRKVINGKVYFYLQWRTPEKNESRILKPEEVELVKAQIENRNALTKQLRALKRNNYSYSPS